MKIELEIKKGLRIGQAIYNALDVLTDSLEERNNNIADRLFYISDDKLKTLLKIQK